MTRHATSSVVARSHAGRGAGEHPQVGVTRTHNVGVVDAHAEHVLQEAQRHEHGGEGMGHDAVTPVVEPRVTSAVAEDVPGMQVVGRVR